MRFARRIPVNTRYFRDVLLVVGLALTLGVSACGDDPAAPEPAGDPSFSRMLGGLNVDENANATVTSDGLRVVAGVFAGTLHITGAADSLVSAAGSSDISLTAFDADGKLVWKHRYGGDSVEIPFAVVRDGNDNFFIAGLYQLDTNFEGTDLTGHGGNDVLVARIDANGNVAWAVGGGSAGRDRALDAAVATDGGVFVCGGAEGQFPLAGQTVGEADECGFLVRLSSLGGSVWNATAGGPSDASCEALARAGDGSVYVTGNYATGDLTFAGATFASDGGADGFIAHFSDAGDPLGAIRIGGSGASLPRGIAVIDSEPVVAGFIFGTADFDLTTAAGNHTAAGGTDVFVARYRANGTVAWVRVFGGAQDESATDICRMGDDLLIAGLFHSTITFGGTTLTTNGGDDAFMLRITGDGNVVSAIKVGSTSDDGPCKVVAAGASAILVGSAAGDTRFPDGTTRQGFGGPDQYIYQQ
jgi:hypothetical protein